MTSIRLPVEICQCQINATFINNMLSRRKKRKLKYTDQNKVRLIRGGKSFFDCLLELIANARESIHLQTYIYSEDTTGKQIADALKDAARRKVDVHLLVDGYASSSLSHHFIEELKEAGVKFRFFEPLFKSRNFYFGRRLHHKVVVVDARYSLVGGINITDRYNDMPDTKAWLDFALLTEGEVVKDLCELCWKTWYGYPVKLSPTPCAQQTIQFNFSDSETSSVRMCRNDWVRGKNEISGTYVQMFRTAQSNITILCSYFLPGRVIRKQLAFAARRGVNIRVVAAGMSDVRTAKYAERYLYQWLLRNKIELYEYQPNVLHGKITVCDGEWTTLGSYNINDISAYASIETNLNVRDIKFAAKAMETLNGIIEKDCIRITTDTFSRSQNLLKRLIAWLSYQFVRMMLYLFTFYFKRKH
jgi:cardiolipin synthase